MRITLDQLNEQHSLVIDRLEILSLEGQQYIARLHGPEGLKVLSDRHGQACLFRSTAQVQALLSAFTVLQTEVVHPSAYHEMIGMTETDVEPLRIQIQRRRL